MIIHLVYYLYSQTILFFIFDDLILNIKSFLEKNNNLNTYKYLFLISNDKYNKRT